MRLEPSLSPARFSPAQRNEIPSPQNEACTPLLSGADVFDVDAAQVPAAALELIRRARRQVSTNLPLTPEVVAALKQAASQGLKVQYCVNVSAGRLAPVEDPALSLLGDAGVDVFFADGSQASQLPPDSLFTDVGGWEDDRLTTPTEQVALGALYQQRFHLPVNPEGFGVKRGQVRVFSMPETGGDELRGELRRAQKQILISAYSMRDPGIYEELRAAVKRQVAVYVMLEPEPVGESDFAFRAEQLRKLGAQVKPTPEAFSEGFFVDHAKWMTIDSGLFIVSTGNFGRSNLGSQGAPAMMNNEQVVVSRQPSMVQESETLFWADWNRTPIEGAALEHLILSPNETKPAMLAFIGAQRERCFMYQQSLKDPDVIDALIAAHRDRGVDVRVALGYQVPKPGQPQPPNGPARDCLIAGGLSPENVFFFTRHYQHAKTMIGDAGAFISSANATRGGLGANRELGVWLQSAEEAEALAQRFLAQQEAQVGRN